VSAKLACTERGNDQLVTKLTHQFFNEDNRTPFGMFHGPDPDTATRLDSRTHAMETLQTQRTDINEQDPKNKMNKWVSSTFTLPPKPATKYSPAFSEKQYDGLDHKEANQFWKNSTIKEKYKKHILKARYGQMMTQQRLHQWFPHKYLSPLCTLCPQGPNTPIENGPHILLGCNHRILAGMRTKRHDRACHIVKRTIKYGKMGRFVILTNAGIHDGEHPEQTILPWMLGAHTIPPCEGECGKPTCRQTHNKPDIVYIKGMDYQKGKTPPLISRTCQMYIIEIGYTWDHKWEEKVEQKKKTYAKLIATLTRAGWKPPIFLAIPLGVTGAPNQHTRAALMSLGVDKDRYYSCMKSLRLNAYEYVGSMSDAHQALTRELRKGVG
jgi:hypothetical protein